jgi:acetyltransferase-like isoleucine patch superfamily enzyme
MMREPGFSGMMAAMRADASPAGARRAGAGWRMGVTIAAMVVTEAVVCGLAALPSAALWAFAIQATPDALAVRIVTFGFLAPFSYALFAFVLMPVSATATWLTSARTPETEDLPIAEMRWPMMRWARYMVSIHIVRVFAGTLYRSSPVWTWYLRMNGARIGRRVYVNSLYVSDHNLIEIGDDVVIGADVHLSAHTVERGLLRIAPVRLGRRVMLGVNTVVDIGVHCEDGCQVAALSFIPKHSRLEANCLYGGVPVRLLRRPQPKAVESLRVEVDKAL